MDHRHRQREALAHTQGQAVRQGVDHVTQTEAFHHLLHPGRDTVCGEMKQPGMQLQVLPYCQFSIERECLRHEAHALAVQHSTRIDALTKQPCFPCGGWQQPGKHLHGRGLAAAVGAQKTEDLAALDAETDVVDGHEIPEVSRQPTGFDRYHAVFGAAWRHHEPAVPAALVLGEQRDERLFQRARSSVLLEVMRAASGQHLAGVHGDQPVKTFGLVHVGGGHQHTHAWTAAADMGDEFPELAPGQGIDAGGGLVKNQQVRVVDERTAQSQLLLHAA